MHTLSAASADAFHRDGYLVLPGLIDPSRLAGMRAALAREVDAIMAGLLASGAVADAAVDLPLERRLIAAGSHADHHGRSWTDRLAVRETWELHHDPGLLAAVAGLLGPAVHGHRQFNVRPKLPGQDLTVVPWHQDSGYYGAETARDLVVTAWLPLVPVDAANGCMQVVPGSHHRGALRHAAAGDAGGFLRIDAEVDERAAVTIAMRPGDALLMHNLVHHRSTANRSQGIRWSVDLRFWRPGSPSAERLLAGFPQPWVLTGPGRTPCERWAGWYRGQEARGASAAPAGA